MSYFTPTHHQKSFSSPLSALTPQSLTNSSLLTAAGDAFITSVLDQSPRLKTPTSSPLLHQGYTELLAATYKTLEDLTPISSAASLCFALLQNDLLLPRMLHTLLFPQLLHMQFPASETLSPPLSTQMLCPLRQCPGKQTQLPPPHCKPGSLPTFSYKLSSQSSMHILQP